MKAKGVLVGSVVVAFALPALATTVNVKELGASGNGTSDDLPYIQRALSRANDSDTLTVVVPAGTYRVSKPLSIYSNTTLQLEDNAAVVMDDGSMLGVLRAQHRKASGGNCPMDATCTHGGYTQVRNIKVSGGTWYHRGASGGDAYVIQIQHGEDITLENLSCKGNVRHHFNCSGSKDVVVRNVKFLPSDAHPYVIPSAEAELGDMRLREAIHVDFMTSGGELAYPLDGTPCKDVLIEGCTFDRVIAGVGTHRHYNADGSAEPVSRLAEHITVSNCCFNSILSYAVSMYGFSDSSFVGNRVICDHRLGYAPGIRVNGVGSVLVSDNLISNPAWHGMLVESLPGESLTVRAARNTIDSPGACGISMGGSQVVVALDCNTVSNALSHGFYAVDGATIRASGNALAEIGGCALAVYGSGTTLTFSDGMVDTTKADGVRAQSQSVVTVLDSVFKGVGQHGILVQSEAAATISGCTFDSPSRAGAYLINPGISVLEYNVFANAGESTYAAIYAENVLAAPTAALRIIGNNIISSKSNGIYIKNSSGVDIQDNTIAGTASGGVYYRASDCGNIVSNKVTDAGAFGILVAGEASATGPDAVASANVIGNVVATAAGSTSSDINIGAYVGDCTVSGNTCRHNGFYMSSEAVNVTYHPVDATITSIKVTSDDSVRVSWAGLAGVSGYFVEYSETADFAKWYKCENVPSGTCFYDISRLSASDTWYVRVRAYHALLGAWYESPGDLALAKKVDMSGLQDIVYYAVHFDANGGNGVMADQTDFICGVSNNLAKCNFTRPGHVFLGWALSATAAVAEYADEDMFCCDTDTVVDNAVTLYAIWELVPAPSTDPDLQPDGPVPEPQPEPQPEPDPDPDPEPEPGSGEPGLEPQPEPEPEPAKPPRLYDEVTGVPDLAKFAQIFDGYLFGSENQIVGTIQVKAAKFKVDRKKKTTVSKVSASVVLLKTGRKIKFKNGFADTNGVVSVMKSAGCSLRVLLGADALSGTMTIDGTEYAIDGARSIFSAKDQRSSAKATQILAKWKNRSLAIAVINSSGKMSCITAAVGAKGKVKIAGVAGNGAKISANAQLAVGADGRMAIPVVITKKTKMAFCIWLAGDDVAVLGLDGTVISGLSGKKIGSTVDLGVVPDGYSRYSSAKSEAFKLKLKGRAGEVKGTFKLLKTGNGTSKKVVVSISGVLIGNKAYCMATIKNGKSWIMTVTP